MSPERVSIRSIVQGFSSILVGLVVVCAPVSVSHAAIAEAESRGNDAVSSWVAGASSEALFAQIPVSGATFRNFGYVTATDSVASLMEKFNQEDFLALTNRARRSAGLPELTLNDQLAAAARAKAIDMVTKGYWEHFRPGDNKAPWAFIKEAGYQYKSAGENLARGFETPQGVTAGWMNSPTHRANILSTKYTEVGYACVRVTDANGESVLFTVQMFGRR